MLCFLQIRHASEAIFIIRKPSSMDKRPGKQVLVVQWADQCDVYSQLVPNIQADIDMEAS